MLFTPLALTETGLEKYQIVSSGLQGGSAA